MDPQPNCGDNCGSNPFSDLWVDFTLLFISIFG